jgi:hypothetical protein
MRNIFFPLFLMFFAAAAFGQKVMPVEDKNLVTLLNAVETLTVASDDDIAVRVYRVSNLSGSAHVPGDDEVSHRFLIAVSTIDEEPEVYLYNVGDFYAAKILGLTNTGKGAFRLSLEYDAPKRKRAQVNITLTKVTLINKR